MLQKKLTDSHYSQILEKIEVQTDRVSRIVKNLLNFARNPAESAFHKVSIRGQPEGDHLAHRVQAQGHEHQAGDEPGPGQAHLGAGRAAAAGVHQHHPQRHRRHAQGGGTLRIEADGRRQGGGRQDRRHRARGSQPQHLPHIFDPSSRPRGSGKGTGLGLSISYAIIKEHEGNIRVESEVGQGNLLHHLGPRRPRPAKDWVTSPLSSGTDHGRKTRTDPCHRRRADHPRGPEPAPLARRGTRSSSPPPARRPWRNTPPDSTMSPSSTC